MSEVRVFRTPVTDQYGGYFPSAIVAISGHSQTSQVTSQSVNDEGIYTESSKFEAITYRANYWYDDQTKATGKRSRPYCTDDDGKFDDVMVVDLENPEIMQILDSDLDHKRKILDAIELDAKRVLA